MAADSYKLDRKSNPKFLILQGPSEEDMTARMGGLGMMNNEQGINQSSHDPIVS
jgi:hypothetical protein